ncbi:MAG TPA: hypothetical protein VGB10_06630 [Bacteroidota bacterium]
MVGDDEDLDPKFVRFTDGLRGAWNKPEVFRADEKINLRIDCAVAVEEYPNVRKVRLVNVAEAPYTG